MGNLKREREIHFTVVKNFRAKKFFAKLVDAKSFASSQQQQIFYVMRIYDRTIEHWCLQLCFAKLLYCIMQSKKSLQQK